MAFAYAASMDAATIAPEISVVGSHAWPPQLPPSGVAHGGRPPPPLELEVALLATELEPLDVEPDALVVGSSNDATSAQPAATGIESSARRSRAEITP